MSSYLAGDDAFPDSDPRSNSSPLSKSLTQRSGYQIQPGTDDANRGLASTGATKLNNDGGISRNNTLSKRMSLRKRNSLRRTKSGRSLKAGSMKGLDDDDFYSVFHTPIPTSGTPTDTLANRFTAWRKMLKDLITYFREIQASYDSRSKALLKIQNVINASQVPSMFLSQGGIDEANNILRNYHKQATNEAKRAQDVEIDVINQLSGLRSSLNQKIKEIKSLSGDFKNSVDKEKEHTRRAVAAFEESLLTLSHDPSAAAGKNDPFIVRLQVEKQVERQIEEENYLHRAYLNLESSGRELESIIVGEIQKAYNAYASIMKREADANSSTMEELRSGPIAMPKDQEWKAFIDSDLHFVSPDLPLRRQDNMIYPGKFDLAAAEIRAGNLERKSKYLKSYTAGWYVLSSTHLHEFKSPDHIHLQQPVMSLCLLDQKLGSHSNVGSSSDKFSLKGAQTGGMHRGHSWVFRAESYDTMMAWYNDIRILTEKSSAEKTAFIRQHARSVSGGSRPTAPSISSDGIEDDEADSAPYAANVQQSAYDEAAIAERPKRPEPGGRFPSDFDLSRENRLQAPLSSSSPGDDSEFRAYGLEVVDATRPAENGDIHGLQPLSSDHSQTDGGIGPTKIRPDDIIDELNQSPLHQTLQPLTISQSGSVDQIAGSKLSPAPVLAPSGRAATDSAQESDKQREEIAPIKGNTVSRETRDTAISDAPENEIPLQTITDSRGSSLDDPTIGPRRSPQTTSPLMSSNNVMDDVAGGPHAPHTEIVEIAQSRATQDGRPPTAYEHSVPISDPPTSKPQTNDSIRTEPHAHQTNHLFPSVIRHDTSTSISQLHVPGEFPGRSSSHASSDI